MARIGEPHNPETVRGEYSTLVRGGPRPSLHLRTCRLVESARQGAPREHTFDKDEITIGADEENDLVIADGSVSRHHGVVLRDDAGYRLKDLDSTNGSFIDHVRVRDGYLAAGSTITIGDVALLFRPAAEKIDIEPSPRDHLGDAVGAHPKMRELFGIIERIAPRDTAILIEGETGTGKDIIARALHDLSLRAKGPFVLFDCAAISAALADAELFGHERGSFTGATTMRPGLFEAAEGGTLFLDEIGDLPLELQPKLLGAIERREVRRVGANGTRRVNVRIVAATNRNLESDVKSGRFRLDLFHRLSVVQVDLPPLRERREDIPALCQHLLGKLASNRDPSGQLRVKRVTEGALGLLAKHDWPGNVRELSNVLERALILTDAEQIEERDLSRLAGRGRGEATRARAAAPTKEAAKPATLEPDDLEEAALEGHFKAAKERLVSTFERQYLMTVLSRNHGNVTQASREAQLDRRFFRRLMVKHNLRNAGDDNPED